MVLGPESLKVVSRNHLRRLVLVFQILKRFHIQVRRWGLFIMPGQPSYELTNIHGDRNGKLSEFKTSALTDGR